MSNHIGTAGSLKVGTSSATTAVAELRTWSIETTADTIEDTAMGGSSARTYKPGLTSWSGSCDCWYDETDTGQDIFAVGATAEIKLWPAGDVGSTDPAFEGSVVITGASFTASVDGMVEASFTFPGTGALTESNTN